MGAVALSQSWPKNKSKLRKPKEKEVIDSKFKIIKDNVMKCEPYSCYQVKNVITIKTLHRIKDLYEENKIVFEKALTDYLNN